MGYAPLFDSLTKGTLCGKWPDIGLWPILLSMANWRGEIDATQQYISAVTGLALGDVMSCLDRFCDPEDSSRSGEAGGARLEPIDPKRGWGWRVINFQKYRDKASGADQISDGRNADKVRRYRDRHRATPDDTAGHQQSAPTPPDTDSYSYSDSNIRTPSEAEGVQGEMRAARAATAKRLPDDFELTESRKATAKAEAVNPEREFARFCDHWRASGGSNARKRDWDAAWRNWCRKAADDARRSQRRYVPPDPAPVVRSGPTAAKPMQPREHPLFKPPAVNGENAKRWGQLVTRGRLSGFRVAGAGETPEAYETALKAHEAQRAGV